MSGRAQKVLGEALDLTDEERAEVALELVASLDGPKDADAEGAGSSRSSVARGASWLMLMAAKTGPPRVLRWNRSSAGREARPG